MVNRQAFLFWKNGQSGGVRRFCQLYEEFSYAREDEDRVAALLRYFGEVPIADAGWALFLLTDRRQLRCVLSRVLLKWASEEAGVADWLLDQCKEQVGDVAETAALLLPEPKVVIAPCLHELMVQWLPGMRDLPEPKRHDEVLALWKQLGARERLVINKLLAGTFRSGVARGLLLRALSEYSGVDRCLLAYRLRGEWEVTPDFWEKLLREAGDGEIPGRPCVFTKTEAWSEGRRLEELGAWRVDYLWDGLRAQLICRSGQVFLWSEEGDYIEVFFPELTLAARQLPEGTVLEGVVLLLKDGVPSGNTRMREGLFSGRGIDALKENEAVVFQVYDVFEYTGDALCEIPLEKRMGILISMSEVKEGACLRRVEPLRCESSAALKGLRDQAGKSGARGLLIRDEAQSGRGVSWEYGIEPTCVKAALLYAQRSEGGGAFSMFILGVRQGKDWVSLAKVDTGLSADELKELDAYVREHSIGKQGPVSRVKPEQVFELEYDFIEAASRRRSGVLLHAPRIRRWLRGADIGEVDNLSVVMEQLPEQRPEAGDGEQQLSLGI